MCCFVDHFRWSFMARARAWCAGRGVPRPPPDALGTQIKCDTPYSVNRLYTVESIVSYTARFTLYGLFKDMGCLIHGFAVVFPRPRGTVKLYVCRACRAFNI